MSSNFIIYFFIMAVSAVGLGQLYLHLIQPLQLLSFMQRALNLAKERNVFLYKSIGGCKICTIQRFADVTYILLLIIHPIAWYYAIAFYMLFGGLVFFFESLNHQPVQPIVKSENIEL